MAAGSSPSRRSRSFGNIRLGEAVRWEVGVLLVVLLALTGRVLGFVLAGVVLILMVGIGVPFGGKNLIDRVRRRLDFRARARDRVETPEVPAELVPLGQWLPGLSVNQTRSARGDDVGVITDGVSWTALLGVVSDDELIADSGEQIDLDALSGLTVQEDIIFAALQVITFTSPAPARVMLTADSPAIASYAEIAQGDPPPAVRRTWLGVRLDPRLCLEAVASRGATNDAIYATLRFGLHRVQSALKRQGIDTRELTAREIYEVLSLTSGASPERSANRSQEFWDHWECDGFIHRGRQVASWGENASLGYQAVLDALDNAPIVFGLTSFTLDRSNHAAGAVRFVTMDVDSALRVDDWLSSQVANRVTFTASGGDQVPAMLGTVPLGRDVRLLEAQA